MSCPAHDLAKSRRMLVEEDVDLIQEAVAMLEQRPDLLVVELDTGSGTTALSVFAARADRVKIISIDNGDEGRWGQLAVENIGRADDFQLIRTDTTERTDEMGVADESVDLLLMDASHKADDLRKELKTWMPAVKSDGLIWVHDYGDPEEFGLPVPMSRGVKRTIDALENREELVTIRISGLGWLGRKA